MDQKPLSEIKAGMTYRSLVNDGWCRVVGFLGKNSLVFENVALSFNVTMKGTKVRVRRTEGRQVYKMTLDDFADQHRLPTPEDAT